MKKIIQTAVTLGFATVLFLAASPVAHAAVQWNSYDKDCPTVSVANHTTQQNAGNTCWGPTVSARPGETVNVRVYYHNTGNSTADNTIIRISQPQGTQSNFTFTGFVNGGGASAFGSATVNLTSPSTLTLSRVYWYPDKKVTDNGLYNGQSASNVFTGLNIGSIWPPSDCPTSDAYCHSGSVVISFIVAGSGSTGSTCSINTFSSNPTSINAGQTATLLWSTPGCTSVSISGLGAMTSPQGGAVSTGILNNTQSYTLTASGSGGVQKTLSTTVTVNNAPSANCEITSFYPIQNTINSGNSTTLSWTTTNCKSVTISGLSGSYPANGTVSTGVLNNTQNYTLTAIGSNGSSDTANTTVTVNQTSINTCTVNSFYASPSSVSYGQTAQLYWNTTGCNYVNITGGGVSGSNLPAASSGYNAGAVYGPTTYYLTAYGNGGSASANTTVYANNNTNTNICQITSFYASPSQVSYGGTSTVYWTTNNCTSVNVTGAAYSGGMYANSSTVVGPIYGTTNVTINAYGSNGSDSRTLQISTFNINPNPNPYPSNATPITLAPSVVGAYSARLNGLIPQAGLYSAYFEYGTSEALGYTTNQQQISGGNNYFNTITTSPDTTYYYRAVANYGGQIYRGNIIAFTSAVVRTGGNGGGTVVIRTGTGTGTPLVALTMTGSSQSVAPGDTVMYTVTYRNISSSNLTNAMLNVILPEGVTFRSTTQGMLTTNNTVAVPIATLIPNQEGTVTIMGVVNPNVVAGSTLVAQANLAFTTLSGAQDSATAYILTTVTSRVQLAGFAFGAGFFPTTLLGWILLIAIIIIVILIARRLSRSHVAPVAVHTTDTHH